MKYFCLLLFFSLTYGLFAQQAHTVNASGKKITFTNVSELTIKGSSSGDLKIEREEEYKVDKRAIGLRKISATGKQDNTGLGVSVTKDANGNILVEQIGSKGNRLIVTVPNSAIVSVNSVGTEAQTLIVNDFSGELDVTNQYNGVQLNNVSGPIAASSVYGNIEAVFSKSPTHEVQLISSYSAVDVSLPANAKADVNMQTSYGSMYTDFDLEVPANGDGDGHDGSGLEAKINGGGTRIVLIATYEDIYLRKQ